MNIWSVAFLEDVLLMSRLTTSRIRSLIHWPDDSSVSSFVLGEQVVENLSFDSTQVETCTLRYSQRYFAFRMLKGVPR